MSDQQYVDVADVKNGKQCGCVCPSCKMPLQAKQGNINQWHFSHSSRGASALTRSECKYSFWVSVVSMAKELMRKGGTLTVPSCTKYLGHDEIFITEAKSVQIFKVELEKNGFDVFCDFGKYAIGLYFTSPETRHRKTQARSSTGVLEISLLGALEAFFSPTRDSDYKSILSGIIFDDLTKKEWIYHPKIEYYKQRYGARLSDKPPYNLDSVLAGILHVKPKCYQCENCKIKWRGIQECPDCHRRTSKVVVCGA